jgi:hypothetical protein
MRRLIIPLIPFLFVSSIAWLHAVDDPAALRFSAATIAALNDATATSLFRIEDSPPPGRFIKEEQRFDLSELQGWLQKQRKDEKTLSSRAYLGFKDILFDPVNHYQGIFNVFVPTTYSIAFQSKGMTGYIVIYQGGLIAVVWEGRWEAALLNKVGTTALEKWNRENG